MKALGKGTVKVLSRGVNISVLTVVVLLIAFAGYALWDSERINKAADKSQYAIYKPTAENEGKTFKELQALNDEIIAWLSVYGTNIDYPVTQGGDNMKYVNTNAEGLYSLSGAIFLDYHNSRDFSDFNSIIYGHHMEKKTMFGEIGEFAKKEMFDSHRYGNLYFDEQDHGIEFFAFIHTSAYDDAIFRADVKEGRQQEYLDGLLEAAIYKRDIGVTTDDRIVLLTTCSAITTNGRDLLVGRITDRAFADPYETAKSDDVIEQPEDNNSRLAQIRLLNIILLLALVAIAMVILYRQRNKKGA